MTLNVARLSGDAWPCLRHLPTRVMTATAPAQGVGLKRTIKWLLNIVFVLLINNVFKGQTVVDSVRQCSDSVSKEAILADVYFQQLLTDMKSWSEPPVVILLNSYAVNMTLNWLCNTAAMDGVHSSTIIVAMDDESKRALLTQWPKLRIVQFKTPCLQETFKPGDATYLTFFLFRTNLIRALLTADRAFWMLQADTFWRENLLNLRLDLTYNSSDVLLDQQGFDGTSELRRGQMNGANFLVNPTKQSVALFDRLAWFQTNVYVTDADAIKVMCHDTLEYDCQFIPYRYVSGWEWIYGEQSDPPYCIQMDGETEGGKAETMAKYNMWFLHDNASCNSTAVEQARVLMDRGHIPRLYSSSKMKQKFLLGLGQMLTSIPLFGTFYMQYGGIPSMYLQFF
uniref:Nucleotide-diphospho-sugar transferase domain-containing protein n=1 Tax=Plectus sambesii TaxID=2011161 RepID=A0A914XB39_9BILA